VVDYGIDDQFIPDRLCATIPTVYVFLTPMNFFLNFFLDIGPKKNYCLQKTADKRRVSNKIRRQNNEN